MWYNENSNYEELYLERILCIKQVIGYGGWS